jgi:hypothetical protein
MPLVFPFGDFAFGRMALWWFDRLLQLSKLVLEFGDPFGFVAHLTPHPCDRRGPSDFRKYRGL